MKKTLVLLSIAVIGSMTLTACKKKGCTDSTAANYNSSAKKDDASCVYTPSITIIGAADTTINVGTTYTDLGATATNKDGASVAVTTTNNTNANLVGDYTVDYTATNPNGTATATRTVHVVIGKDNWLQAWNVSNDCSATKFPLTSNPTITEGPEAGTLLFDGMFTLFSGTVTATYSGDQITFTNQTVTSAAGDITFSGSGTMTPNGNIINVSFSYDNTIPLLGGTGTCSGTFTK